MECHGLLGNGPVDAEKSRAYELCRSFGFGALSPASSTRVPGNPGRKIWMNEAPDNKQSSNAIPDLAV